MLAEVSNTDINAAEVQLWVQKMPLKNKNRISYADFVQWWAFFDAQKAFNDYDGNADGHPDGQMDVNELMNLLRDLGTSDPF